MLKSEYNLVLEICNNGKGLKAEMIEIPSSVGLLGMRERIRLFAGSVNLTGRPGKGTTASVTVQVLLFSAA